MSSDLLANAGFGELIRSREERARQLEQLDVDFLAGFEGDQRVVVDGLIDKYRLGGIEDIASATVFQIPPFVDEFGGVASLAKLFGGAAAVTELLRAIQEHLYPIKEQGGMTAADLVALIKSASNKMRADDNTKSTAKYLEHFSWLLFLKVYEQVQEELKLVSEIDGRAFQPVIESPYRWSDWTKAKMTGDDLVVFVTDELLPYLRDLSGRPESRKIAEIFSGVSTVMKSGYVLAEVIDIVDKVDFHNSQDYHAMSVLYESLLAEMGSDAGVVRRALHAAARDRVHHHDR